MWGCLCGVVGGGEGFGAEVDCAGVWAMATSLGVGIENVSRLLISTVPLLASNSLFWSPGSNFIASVGNCLIVKFEPK